MSIEAMKQALEAAEVLEKLFRQAEAMHKGSLPSMNLDCQITTEDLRKGLYAAATLRTAIEKAEKQEPDYKALYEKASQQYNELAALMDKPAPVQEPDLTEIPMIMTCTKCGAFGEAMLTLETQPAQKPVNVTSKMVQAFLYAAGRHFPWGGSDPAIEDGIKAALEAMPTPPAAQRQPLTEDEIDDIWNRYCDEMGEASINDAYDIVRAIEAAHGIKEKNA